MLAMNLEQKQNPEQAECTAKADYYSGGLS